MDHLAQAMLRNSEVVPPSATYAFMACTGRVPRLSDNDDELKHVEFSLSFNRERYFLPLIQFCCNDKGLG
jgi:hypothetical protein